MSAAAAQSVIQPIRQSNNHHNPHLSSADRLFWPSLVVSAPCLPQVPAAPPATAAESSASASACHKGVCCVLTGLQAARGVVVWHEGQHDEGRIKDGGGGWGGGGVSGVMHVCVHLDLCCCCCCVDPCDLTIMSVAARKRERRWCGNICSPLKMVVVT